MGNEQGNSKAEQEQSFVSQNYTHIHSKEDKRIGRISLYKNKTSGQFVWLKEVKIDEENDFKHFKEYLESDKHKSDVLLTKEAAIIAPFTGFGAICG